MNYARTGEIAQPMSRYNKILSEFLASPLEFQLLTQPLKLAKVLVLDSLFNPPHIAHAKIVKHALQNAQQRAEYAQVMLLLLVNNADKAPIPASFTDRLEMMGLLSQWLEKSYNCQVAIGLTKQAKFIDKALAIDYRHGMLEFLVGFDTLERIIDQKYYENPIAGILESFFERNEIICLTRPGTTTIEQQIKVVNQLNSEFKSHPITIINDNASEVSSSSIRKQRRLGEQWKQWVIPEIAQYIDTHNLYI